jgi:excisionase family DNA binding protein
MDSHGASVNTVARTAPAPLMTVRGVTDVLGVSRQTVYRLIRAGELVPIRVSQSPRFRPADIEAYLERNRDTKAAS